jgi:hypothetical protein
MKTALFALLWIVGLAIVALGIMALISTVDIVLDKSHPFFGDWRFWSNFGCVLLAHIALGADVYCGKLVQQMKL